MRGGGGGRKFVVELICGDLFQHVGAFLTVVCCDDWVSLLASGSTGYAQRNSSMGLFGHGGQVILFFLPPFSSQY